MRPRNLRLLRIDDQILYTERLPEGSFAPPSTADEAPPAHIDSIVDSNIVAIDGWDTALAFWSGFRPAMLPDLIISDVRFDDPTSPLYEAGDGQLLPTGISHFKPFAAIARASGAPIGVAVHTADPTPWAEKLKSDKAVLRMLSRLAAHEIGELVGILGHLPRGFSALDKDGKILFCWYWLSDNRGLGIKAAFPKAMRNFRKDLSRVYVPPAEWARLANWCRKMGENQLPIIDTQQITGASKEINVDPGFTFILADGTPQCISLLSLFSDAQWESDFDMTKTPLPSHCFALDKHDDFFSLDDTNLPRIGALVAACSRYHDVYQSARKVLEHFVDMPPAKRLSVVEGDDKFGEGAIALAILLKYVEGQRRLFLDWKTAYETFGWLAASDLFVDEHADSKTLKAYVRDVAQFFSSQKGETFHSAELKERLEHIAPLTINRCVAILLALACIVSRPDGSLEYCADYKGTTPPIPPDFEGPLSISAGVPREFALSSRKFLALAFGYPADNYNSLQGRLAKAFGEPGRPGGREFFDRFELGEAPPYVKALCRQYALELGWEDQRLWPKALQ